MAEISINQLEELRKQGLLLRETSRRVGIPDTALSGKLKKTLGREAYDQLIRGSLPQAKDAKPEKAILTSPAPAGNREEQPSPPQPLPFLCCLTGQN